MPWKWKLVGDANTNGTLVHFLWYLGIATTLTALTLFTRKLPTSWLWLVLAGYAIGAVGFAIQALVKMRGRNVLTGILLMAAIIASTSSLFVAQDHFGLLTYEPNLDDYSQCGRHHECDKLPEYSSLSSLGQAIHSPLGPILWAVISSIAAIVFFRFLPMTIIATTGIWYLIFEAIKPTPSSLNRDLLMCGVATLIASWIIDKKLANNYGYWVNKLAMWSVALSLWLVLFDDQNDWWRIAYFISNLMGMVAALYLNRPAGVFGFVVGAYKYVDYLYEDTVVGMSWAFPIVLGLLGVALVVCGYKLGINQKDLTHIIPKWLAERRPHERKEPVFFGMESLFEPLKDH